jgi:ribonuclease HI
MRFSSIAGNNVGTMAKMKFYAVVKGRKPGIYTEWFGAHGAEAQVKGFAAAVYKSFAVRNEAEAWFSALAAGAPAPLHGEPSVSAKEKLPREKKVCRLRQETGEPPAPRVDAPGTRALIYTDGGCSKNPGAGGYGVVLLLGEQRTELSGGYAYTTNNRMELTACIKGLEALDAPCSVTVYSDSQYVVNGVMKGWARRWRSNNWMRNPKEPAENSDLWARLLDLSEKHGAEFQWVRGHDGNQENERCDRLAVEMTQRGDLPPDSGYKKNQNMLSPDDGNNTP